MNTTCDHPRFFPPHANLSDAVNNNIVQSEIEGGVHLQDLPPGTVLEVQTQNRSYTILYKGWDQALISGRSGHDSRVQLGRLDAQDAFHRTRHAPGVWPPGVRPDPHFRDFGRTFAVAVDNRYITRWRWTGCDGERNAVSHRSASWKAGGASR